MCALLPLATFTNIALVTLVPVAACAGNSFILVTVTFPCVKNHPPFIFSAVDWPRLVFSGELGAGHPQCRGGGQRARWPFHRLLGIVQISFNKPHASQLLFSQVLVCPNMQASGYN